MRKILIVIVSVLAFGGVALADEANVPDVAVMNGVAPLSDTELDTLRGARLGGIAGHVTGYTISPSSHYSLVFDGKTWKVVWN